MNDIAIGFSIMGVLLLFSKIIELDKRLTKLEQEKFNQPEKDK